MATTFAMPVQQFTASPSQYTLHSSQAQQISPVNSATGTPSNGSPTSPRTGVPAHIQAHTRQLRAPKSPLYIPAVLRPTDPPRRARQAPLTPPQSQDSSFDDLDKARRLNRRSTVDSGKSGFSDETEWTIDVEGLGQITDKPKKTHWKPDSASSVCDDPRCTKSFTWINRKHHCRRCGDIFCNAHTPFQVPLDQDANYHPNGYMERACTHCYRDYNGWKVARTSRSNSSSSNGEEPVTPTMNCMKPKAMGGVLGQGLTGGMGDGQAAASVPRDWHWSTF